MDSDALLDDSIADKRPQFSNFCNGKMLKGAAMEVCMIIPFYQRIIEMMDNILTREITQVLSLIHGAIAKYSIFAVSRAS